MFAVGHISILGTNRLGIITKTNSSIDRNLPNFGLIFDVYGSDISNIIKFGLFLSKYFKDSFKFDFISTL